LAIHRESTSITDISAFRKIGRKNLKMETIEVGTLGNIWRACNNKKSLKVLKKPKYTLTSDFDWLKLVLTIDHVKTKRSDFFANLNLEFLLH